MRQKELSSKLKIADEIKSLQEVFNMYFLFLCEETLGTKKVVRTMKLHLEEDSVYIQWLDLSGMDKHHCFGHYKGPIMVAYSRGIDKSWVSGLQMHFVFDTFS